MATFDPCPWRAELQRRAGKMRVSGPCLSRSDGKCYLCGEERRRGMKRHHHRKTVERAADLKVLAQKLIHRAEDRRDAEDLAGREWLQRQAERIADELDKVLEDDRDRDSIALSHFTRLLTYGTPAYKRLRAAIAAPPHRRCACGQAASTCTIMRDTWGRCCAECSCEDKCAEVFRKGFERRQQESAEVSRAVREDLQLDQPASTAPGVPLPEWSKAALGIPLEADARMNIGAEPEVKPCP